MNAERLHAIAAAFEKDQFHTKALALLLELIASLTNQVHQPNQPTFQQQTSDIKTELLENLSQSACNEFSPTWKQHLSEFGASGLVGRQLADQINAIFGRNQITTSVAIKELQILAKELENLGTAMNQLLQSFEVLKIGEEELAPGECDLGVLIPRAFVHDRLDEFADELKELNEIFEVFAEVATGKRPNFRIKTISSTDLSVLLEIAPIVGKLIVSALTDVIAVYKQIIDIKLGLKKLAETNVPQKALQHVEDHANEKMNKEIDTIVVKVLSQRYEGLDSGRVNELKMALTIQVSKLADRVDRGFNIEVRMQQPALTNEDVEPDAATKALVENYNEIKEASENLQFLKSEGPPILHLTEVKNKHETE